MLSISSSATCCARKLVRWHSSSAFPLCIDLPARAISRTLPRPNAHACRPQSHLRSARAIVTSSRRQRAHESGAEHAQSSHDGHATTFSTSQTGSAEHAARLARNEYGDSLPDGALSAEALSVYRRLYGDPLPSEAEREEGNELQSRDNSGTWGAVSARLEQGAPFKYELIEEEEYEEEEEEDVDDEDDVEGEGDDLFNNDSGYIRTHPFTIANRFGTSPTTLQMPRNTFVKPIADMLASSASAKNLEVATQRVFGGLGLPYSPSTPALSRTMPQKPVSISARQSKMPALDADSFLVGVYPHAYASIMSALVEVRKRLGSSWLRGLLEKDGGPVVLDAGAGGAGALAWKDMARAEWEAMQADAADRAVPTNTILEGDLAEERPPMPAGKTTVIIGSDTLRQRASALLDSTTFIPRLPDAVPHDHLESGSPRKRYDVILAPYSLWRIEKDFERKYHVQTLWSLLNPDGGILILLEKGVPRGFEVIAGARDHLLKRHIAQSDLMPEKEDINSKPQTVEEFGAVPIPKEPGMIIAPCTNHSSCPLYEKAGLGRGRKDYCYFSQRFIRPSFLQSVLGARRRNHEDVEFSYIAVQRGNMSSASDGLLQGTEATDRAFEGYGSEQLTTRTQDRRERKARPHAALMDSNIFGDAERISAAEEDVDEVEEEVSPPHSLALPRLILPPLKRKGHIVLDVCTPSGTFERWLVTRRNGKQAYRDARKAKWGDLWALGAKTREPRRMRVGTVEKTDKGHKKSSRGRRKKEIREILEDSGLLED